jgi:hypothetical protein
LAAFLLLAGKRWKSAALIGTLNTERRSGGGSMRTHGIAERSPVVAVLAQRGAVRRLLVGEIRRELRELHDGGRKRLRGIAICDDFVVGRVLQIEVVTAHGLDVRVSPIMVKTRISSSLLRTVCAILLAP